LSQIILIDILGKLLKYETFHNFQQQIEL